MRDDWGGRTVLVTGAAGGIGRAICERFAAARADLYLVDVVETHRHAPAIAASGGRAPGGRSMLADITRVTECARVVDTASQTGRLDLLVNCAGVWVEGPSAAATEADWTRVMDVNLKGAFFMSRYAIPHLVRTGGSIINISSDAGVTGSAGSAIYCASKGGLNLLTRSLAVELAPSGVRVNAVCPGDVASPMLDHQAERYGGGDPQGYRRKLLDAYPQKERARFIQPGEVADLVMYLASPSAAAITGACVAIDFGLTAGA